MHPASSGALGSLTDDLTAAMARAVIAAGGEVPMLRSLTLELCESAALSQGQAVARVTRLTRTMAFAEGEIHAHQGTLLVAGSAVFCLNAS